jgi:hypothetical protein
VRRLWVLAVVPLVVWFSAGAAAADDFDNFDGTDDPGMGIPGWFIAIAVLFVLIGVVTTIYRVSTARSIATKAGLDPDDATRVALLDDDALSATYLASSLHAKKSESTPAAEPGRSTAERLQELQALKDQGLVTEAEYTERRAAILGSV